jgi:hypothetical protein
LIDSYCWKFLLNESDTLELPDFAVSKEQEVKTTCQKIEEELEMTPTTFNSSKSPEAFIPALAFICDDTEKEANSALEKKRQA